jgi:hypothetical protein
LVLVLKLRRYIENSEHTSTSTNDWGIGVDLRIERWILRLLLGCVVDVEDAYCGQPPARWWLNRTRQLYEKIDKIFMIELVMNGFQDSTPGMLMVKRVVMLFQRSVVWSRMNCRL